MRDVPDIEACLSCISHNPLIRSASAQTVALDMSSGGLGNRLRMSQASSACR